METIKGRFRHKISQQTFRDYSKENLGCCGGDYCVENHNKNIEDFIDSELRTLIEKMEEKYEPICRCMCEKNVKAMTFNKGLDTAISIIKKELE